MSDELKACPFCRRGDSAMVTTHPTLVLPYWVECSTCGARGEAREGKLEAIAAWNRRTVTREQYEEMAYELHSECRDLNYKQACAATDAMLRAAGFEVAE